MEEGGNVIQPSHFGKHNEGWFPETIKKVTTT